MILFIDGSTEKFDSEVATLPLSWKKNKQNKSVKYASYFMSWLYKQHVQIKCSFRMICTVFIFGIRG